MTEQTRFVTMREARQLFIASDADIFNAANSNRVAVELDEVAAGDLILFSVADLQRHFLLRDDPAAAEEARQVENLRDRLASGVTGALLGRLLEDLWSEQTPTARIDESKRDLFGILAGQPRRRDVYTVAVSLTAAGAELFLRISERLDGREQQPWLSDATALANAIYREFHEDFALYLVPSMPTRRVLLAPRSGLYLPCRLSLPRPENGRSGGAVAGELTWTQQIVVRQPVRWEHQDDRVDMDMITAFLHIGLVIVHLYGTDCLLQSSWPTAFIEQLWVSRAELRAARQG